MTAPITDSGRLAVCKAIRDAMNKRNLDRHQLGELCFPDSADNARSLATNVTHWINDRGLPGPKYVKIVQKALRLDFDAIERDAPVRTGVVDILRIAHEEAPKAKKTKPAVQADGAHFSFSLRDDGTMSLNIAATVPSSIGWRFVDLMREINGETK